MRSSGGQAPARPRLYDDFDNFVTDLKTFVDHEVKPGNKRLFLLAHSMGGAIASIYLEKYGDDFSAAVFSAPMHQPDLAPIPHWACWLLKLGAGQTYVWGYGPYLSREFNSDRELTGSRVRYEILKRRELDRHPQAQLGGPSLAWAYEACKAANRSIRDAGRIKVEVLLFQAGADRIVKNRGQRRFCERMNASRYQSCILREIHGARHELLIEQDTYRDLVLGEMISFFRQRHTSKVQD
ncbi:alpha/beta fold hydrolase [Rhizobium halophilum]|uniref:alpha/beta fold hydrolase n=1 Tax=Rhizobium halophilum TaxID=2846852 RepID=UPI00293EB450|nr:alpha/beta fold hydrolase [Rhizobium halophilum]